MAFLCVGTANFVSLIRMFATFYVVWLLYQLDSTSYLIAFVLTIAIILADGLDGYLARKLNESSPTGALVDILSDRVVEQVYWVAFAALGWLPVWVPLVVILRGIWVDGFRSLASKQGLTAFGTSSMMKQWWGVLLVSSRFSRWTYAFTKAVAFAFIIAAFQPEPGIFNQFSWVKPLALWSSYIAIVFCVIRGLPVLLEGARFLKAEE